MSTSIFTQQAHTGYGDNIWDELMPETRNMSEIFNT
jgi:hypothetical protein